MSIALYWTCYKINPLISQEIVYKTIKADFDVVFISLLVNCDNVNRFLSYNKSLVPSFKRGKYL